MTYREGKCDLFSVPQGYYLAHCISADFALGKGIAIEFATRFNMRDKLYFNYAPYDFKTLGASCIPIDNVFNLVTKERCYDKPTYESLYQALQDMREWATKNFINHIAMPKIGCGLDGLDWDKVSEMIKEIFDDTDVDILVCYI